MLGLARIKKNEDGFTLVELLVYCVILTALLGGVYTIYGGSESIYKSTNDQADEQRDARLAQVLMVKHLRMADTLDVVEDYAVDVLADVDDDELPDRVSYYVQDENLYTVMNGGNAQKLAGGVRNITLSQPLFIYYDSEGSVIATDTTYRKTGTYQVEVNLVVDADTNNPLEAFTLSSKVTLRNND